MHTKKCSNRTSSASFKRFRKTYFENCRTTHTENSAELDHNKLRVVLYPMKIYLASGNLHKKAEMQALFPEHSIVIPKDEDIYFNPEETGCSFLENSLLKATALWNIVHQPVLADDSGICVDILNGVPGIFSARYAGKSMHTGTPDGHKIPQAEQNRLLLEETNEAVAGQSDSVRSLRSCRYVCAMVLYVGKDRFYSAQETMEGRLIQTIEEARGKGGFGYDPIVILQGTDKTVAELSSEEKNTVSHRGKAARILHRILNTLSL